MEKYKQLINVRFKTKYMLVLMCIRKLLFKKGPSKFKIPFPGAHSLGVGSELILACPFFDNPVSSHQGYNHVITGRVSHGSYVPNA